MLFECLSATFQKKFVGNLLGNLWTKFYEDIGKSFVKKAAIRTKRECRPAGLDADKWLGTIGSNQCDSSSLGLR